MMAIYWSEPRRLPKTKLDRSGYTLVVRGPDGRPHYERFDDAAAYLARLMALNQSTAEGVSIEDILGLLDA